MYDPTGSIDARYRPYFVGIVRVVGLQQFLPQITEKDDVLDSGEVGEIPVLMVEKGFDTLCSLFCQYHLLGIEFRYGFLFHFDIR